MADTSTRASLAARLPIRSSAALLSLLTLGYAVYAIDRTVLSSVLAPLSSSLALSNSEIGLLSAAQYIGVTCTVFIAGAISDRYGSWKVILFGLIVFSAFTWLIGLSTNFIEAFSFRLVSGFGEGAFWPVAMASVASFFQKRKGLGLGIFYVGFDAGSVAGLSIGGITYSLSGSWRPAFFIAPLVGIFVIAGVAVARRTLSSRANPHSRSTLEGARYLLKRRNFVLLMLFALLATWSSVWQVAFLPYYFFKVMHYTVLTSALLASLVTIAGALGKVTLGGISDSVRRNRLLLFVSITSLLSYLLFFLAPSSSFASNLTVALLLGFFSASIFPVLQALVSDYGKDVVGSALGLSTTFQSIATIFSPIITALLFTFGIGRASLFDAMLPVAMSILVALFLKDNVTRRVSIDT